ncbi:MAG: response regulator receiver protein [Ramlibacter sp.]|jgi:DNA-binding response OmpR family regulator|nr:response regulator receiver protein [Ramlibacter sp.]
MALIVLMEDDAATRMMVASVLRKDGHEVFPAEDGQAGLKLVRELHPELVISDVQMPVMNGFDMLAALRLDTPIAGTPVILLTSLQERAHMRIGMTAGADDYITKPFRPAELREAVAAQLNKRQIQADLQALAVHGAVSEALEAQRQELGRLYEKRLAHELSERWPNTAGESDDERFESATVLFVDIARYGDIAQKLQPHELTELVKRFYGNANDTAHLFGARHMQFIGEGLLAVFTDDTNTRTVNHALRAARTAIGLVESAHALRQHLEASYPGRGLPSFSVNAAVQAGAVTLTRLRDALHGSTQQLPVGEAVRATMELQRQAQTLGWPIATSVATLRLVTGGVRTGRRALVEVPGRSEAVDAVELTGLVLQAE